MATLYTQADSNTKKTWFLISCFIVFIIILGWLFSVILDSYAILVIAFLISIFMSFGSYWYSDKIILSMTKAVPVAKKDNPELYRIVENLCIAAGLPLPKIYIIKERQPNAFATGRDAKHAVVAVTQGLLDKLERTELEGVIAHELAHIGNKDILLGTVVVVLVGIVAMLSNLFIRISFYGGGRRRDSKGNAGVLLLILGIIAAILAPLAASLIRMAISRKREFLADASGALLTRYPEGLARAHLFISSPFKGKQQNSWFTKLFMTHPPTEERARALRGMKV